jgi:hypothetical protein
MTESAKNEWQDWTSDIVWVVRQRFPTMRLNVWVVLTILIALFAITRYMRQQQTPRRSDQFSMRTVSLSKRVWIIWPRFGGASL